MLQNSDGKAVPVRFIAEQHIMEDMGGHIPSVQDWLGNLPLSAWMAFGATPLSKELGDSEGLEKKSEESA